MTSDRVRKKIKNYAGIFRNTMRKNMLITRKTRKIIWKFKQFITLIILPFHCFFCYLNYSVRFLLLLHLFKFILTVSLINCKMILGHNERAKEDNVFKFPHASSSQMQFLINYCYSLKYQCFLSNRNQFKNKTSTQAHHQKTCGTPGMPGG